MNLTEAMFESASRRGRGRGRAVEAEGKAELTVQVAVNAAGNDLVVVITSSEAFTLRRLSKSHDYCKKCRNRSAS